MRNIRIILILLFIISSPATVLAQCAQDVLVLLYRGDKPKTPLANVSVIVSNAGSTITDADGRCTLNFKSLVPGDKVTISRLERPGYEVFNKDALDYWYISRNNEPFVILMCESKYLKKLRDSYRKGATDMLHKDLSHQENTLGKDLKMGTISREDYDKKIKQLQQDYESRLDDVENDIYRLAHADFSTMDKTEKKVLDFIKKGDILSALKEYEKVDLVANYAKETQTKMKLTADIEKLEDALTQTKEQQNDILNRVLRQVSLWQMLGGEDNVKKSYKLYEDILMADTTNFEMAYAYANQLSLSMQRNEASRILKYCLNSDDYYDKIRAAILQARILRMNKDWKEAIAILEPVYKDIESESIIRLNPEFYLKERCIIADLAANTLLSLRDTLHSPYFVDKSMEDAKFYLSKTGTDEAKRMLVDAYHTVFLYHYRFDTDLFTGVKMIKEGIALQEEIYRVSPQKHAAILAFLHSHLGAMFDKIDLKNKPKLYFEDMVQQYEIAVNLFEEAYKYNPIAYLNFIPEPYRFLGSTYTKDKNNRNLEKAKYFFDKCEYYIKLLEKDEFSKYITNAAPYYEEMIEYYIQTKEYDKALEASVKAEDLYSQLYKKNKKTYGVYLKEIYEMVLRILNRNPQENAEKIREVNEKKNNLLY